MATHTWMWIGNCSLLDPSPATNITQPQANAAIGWTAGGAEQMAPVDVNATLQGNDIGYRTTYQTQSFPTRIATPFTYSQPPSDPNVTGMTARSFVSATFQVRVPNLDGSGTYSTVNKVGVLMQMSNGDVFIRPAANEINSWDDIPAISQVTVASVAVLPSNSSNTTHIGPVGFNPTIYQTEIVCFARGTQIRTADGHVAIEDLLIGDLIWTRDHGMRPIRWIGNTVVSGVEMSAMPRLRPIRIGADSLAENQPDTELTVSPPHRVVVRSKIAQRMFDTLEILIAAQRLTGIDGITVVEDATSVEYFHILLDQHSIIDSNGAETESLFLGPHTLEAVGKDARQEIIALFPQLADADHQAQAAMPLTTGRRGRQLAARHARSGQPLV